MVNWLEILKLPDKKAQLELQFMLNAYIKLQYLYVAIDSGLLDALHHERSKQELAELIGVENEELFDQTIALGISLGELGFDDGKYFLKGSTSKACNSTAGNAITNFIKEMILLDGAVFKRLPEKLKGGDPEDYLDEYGEIIAQASRIVEPFIKLFIKKLLKRNRKYRILEIGCGSGAYLKYYYERCTRTTGIGIDYNEEVAKLAQIALLKQEFRDNFDILHADIRFPPDELEGPFDLITAYQNIYYFNESERQQLFVDNLSRLAKHGRFAMITYFPGKKPISRYFDIILGSTRGCYPMPAQRQLDLELRQAGFANIKYLRLMPGTELWGVVAQK